MAVISNLGSLRVGVEIPIKDWNKNYGKITNDVKKYPKTTDKALDRADKKWKFHTDSIKKASLGMVAFGTVTVAALGFAVKAAGDFQQSMTNTQAVAGATTEELKQLTSFAREMGKQTVFSAKESADAMLSLASAGQDTQEIMNSLKGTLNLAAATNSDLAFASKTVASTLSQFSLAASESDRIANVFTATISASQATMDKLATSMAVVGPVAKAVGLSLEETTSILGSLFNAGLDASTAGTSLRQAIAQLLKPTDDAKEALRRLKVETVDSGGKLRGITDIIRDLETVGLSAADALTIFGVRAGPGMLALVSQGADAIEDLTEKVTDTNKAAEIAALQTETFQGKMKILQSATSDLKIEIGNQLLPILTDYAVKLTEIVNITSDWAKENPKLTKTLVTLGGTVGVTALALGGIGLAAPGIIVAAKGIGKLGLAAKALVASPVGLWIAGIIAGTAVLAAGLKLGTKAIDDTREAAFGSAVTQAQRNNMAQIQRGIDEATGELEKLNEALAGGTTHISDLNKVTGEWVNIPMAQRIGEVQLKVVNLGRELRIAGGDFDGMSTETTLLGEALVDGLGKAIDIIENPLSALTSFIGGLKTEAGLTFDELRTSILQTGTATAETVDIIERERGREVGVWITKNDEISDELADHWSEMKSITLDGMRALEVIEGGALAGSQEAQDRAALDSLGALETTEKKTIKIVTSGNEVVKKIRDDGSLHMKVATDLQIREGERRGKEMIAITKTTTSEIGQIWNSTAGNIKRATSDLFASMIDPSIKPAWEQFWDSLKTTAIKGLSDIVASAAWKAVTGLFSQDVGGIGVIGQITSLFKGGGTSIAGAAATGAVTTTPTASTAIGAISSGTKIGTLAAAAAPVVIPLALAAAGFGIFAAISGSGESAKELAEAAGAIQKKRGSNAVIGLRRLADEEKKALKEADPRRRDLRSARRGTMDLPQGVIGIGKRFGEGGLPFRGQPFGFSRTPVSDLETAPSFQIRRPQGTDRFGRPLPATVAMAAPGRQQAGDVNININVVVEGQDIRDMDIAEWQRIFRDNLQPAAEAEGQRFVRSDNLMVS